MHGTVPILGKLLEDVTHTGLGADYRIAGDAQPLRQGIRRLETNAVDVESQTIWILLHAVNGLVTIGFVNPDCTSRPNTMRVQKDHDLPNDFLRVPRVDNTLFPFRPDPVECRETVR